MEIYTTHVCPACGGKSKICPVCGGLGRVRFVHEDEGKCCPVCEDGHHKRPPYEDDDKHRPVCKDDPYKRPSHEDEGKCCPVCEDSHHKRPPYEDDDKHRPACKDDPYKRPSHEDKGKCCPVCEDGHHKRPPYEDDDKHRPACKDDPYKRPSHEDEGKHCPVCGGGAGSCPICDTPPEPFRNTASAAGQYRCSAGCRGDVCAVSAPVLTEVVDVTLDKAVSCPCARAGQTVRYTITVCNRSSIPVSCVRVTDPGIEKCLKVGTICCNGRPVPGGSLCRGIEIPGIGAGCCAAITFDATVPECAAGTICNVAYAEFEFETECGLVRQNAASNEVVLNIVSPSLEIQKKADRCAVSAEENVVTYTLTACNTGSCPIENVVITDVLPAGLTYVPCSTSVKGCQPFDRNPAAGICVGTLCVGECAEVTFQAAAFDPC